MTSVSSTSSRKKYRHSTSFYRKLKACLNNETKSRIRILEEYFPVNKCMVTSTKSSPVTVKSLGNVDKSEENDSVQAASVIMTGSNCNQNENTGQMVRVVEESSFDFGEDIVIPPVPDENDFLEEEEQREVCVSQILLAQQLTEWFYSHQKMSHLALNSLLNILKSHGMNFLPADSRTLLRTPSSVNLKTMGKGQFWYNGVQNCLSAKFPNLNEPLFISLIFNIDGLPPFAGASIEFWPILLRIENMAHVKPMVVAIYCGEGKPPLQEYLSTFVDELNYILKYGILINGHEIKVRIKYFVCDTPARSFIKGTVGFNAAHGCIKCTVVGEFDKKGRHMSFPRTDCPLRTDESFRNQWDEDHHKENTPLLKLPINMVDDIIVADSLHLFDLGVMRKCLYGWVHGSYNFRTKLSGAEIDSLSSLLEESNKTKPVEIHRAIRRLSCLKFWKGTEFRTFLLYLGPVVLLDFLPTEVYYHFLQLFIAVTILSCNSYSRYIEVADCLLNDYIEQFINIYGIDSISSNIHNLCHVIKDVKQFGNLSEISTYPFENYLGQLKSLLRTGSRPLAQIVKRVIEQSKFDSISSGQNIKQFPILKGQNLRETHLLSFCKGVYNRLEISDNFCLKNDIKNMWFLTKQNEIVSMINATYYADEIYIYGSPIIDKADFFTLPVKSSNLNIYQSTCQKESPRLYSLQEVKCKLFLLKYQKKFVFFPLIHTLDIN